MSNSFFIGIGQADILIENSRSLKDRRRIVTSLKEKLKNGFNLSVCEFGDQSLWQRAQLGLAFCSNDMKIVISTLNQVDEYLQNNHLITLLNFEKKVV
jgi:hypothetical protein